VFMLTVSMVMLLWAASLTTSPATGPSCAVVRFRIGV
jgi:hypothetical protein